ncbi:MAG: hypothetical protein CTY28_10245 [Hyphomicrobium sp.]|nr:MAG: hypothetical protein CTY28_10245 [Hyphomicrobium sp.]
MTDAAERAREIAIRHTPVHFQAQLQDAIAAALREAENAAYEKALIIARDIDFPVADMGDVCADFIEGWNSACAHIATAIRALQDKGE